MNRIATTNVPAHQKNDTDYTLFADTLIDSLVQRTQIQSNFLIFMDLKNKEERISAEDVYSNALSTAQYLTARGLEKNDKVIIMLPTSKEFAYIYFGILIAGGVPVPVSQPAGTSHIEKYLDNLTHIIRDSEAKFFITYEKIRSIAGSLMSIPALQSGFIFSTEIFANPVDTAHYQKLPQITGEDLALIQYTSGTTGKPKGVMLSHKNLLHNIHGIGVASNMTDKDVGISWLPMYHDMGLIGGFLTTIYWKISMIFMMPEAFIFKPNWWLENISKYRVTMGVAPNFGYHYCVTRIPDETVKKLDLSSWRLALNGAEPIDRSTLNKFIEKFKPGGLREDIFFPVYGMAENSLAATFPSVDNTTVIRRFDRIKLEEENLVVESHSEDSKKYIDLVSVGYPLVGQEVRIVDEAGRTLKEQEVGEVLVKSRSLTTGYYKNEEATANTIRDGWLHSGDMGFIINGMLFISGRKKEMIIKRGKNIYPYDVERVASTVDGVRLGCVAAFAVHNESKGTEDLILVCETTFKDKDKVAGIEKEINSEILAKLGFSPDDIKIVPKGTIPKTTSGKIQRIFCKKIYLEDDFLENKKRNLFILMKTFLLSQVNLLKKRLKRD